MRLLHEALHYNYINASKVIKMETVVCVTFKREKRTISTLMVLNRTRHVTYKTVLKI